MLSDRLPCHQDNRFLQSGEQRNWHLLPDTVAAVTICETECPISRVVECAREALGSGRLLQRGQRRNLPRPASGVVAAGIICRGTDETRDALDAVIARYSRSSDPVKTCTGCERALVSAGTPITDPDTEAHHGGRGLCKGCYAASSRGGHIRSVRQPRPSHCVGCSRPMVGRNDDAPDGHVRHHSRGQCVSCQVRARRSSQKAAA